MVGPPGRISVRWSPSVLSVRARSQLGFAQAAAFFLQTGIDVMSITETVLEMHYHHPLMELIRDTYGLGLTGSFNFYKYSPQREVFLGFDQAYAMTELSDEDFFKKLSAAAMNDSYQISQRFLAYFLQFKVVSEMKRHLKHTPQLIQSRPHYRVSLDTTKNDRTGFSQHELLYNLERNDGAMVYYACPMIFDKGSLYEVDVNLDLLRLVEMSSCPSSFADNSNHYVYFDQKDSEPIWCSDPVKGSAVSPQDFAKRLVDTLRQASPEASRQEVFNLLNKIKGLAAQSEKTEQTESDSEGLALVADSLMIVELVEVMKS